MKREATGVRPSVLLLCACLLAGMGFAVWQTFSFEPSARGDESSADAQQRRRGRRDRARDRRLRSTDRSVHASTTHGGTGAYQHHDWDRESELSRAIALHLPDPSFWREGPRGELPRRDPQLFAMWRSFHQRVPAQGDAPDLPFEPTAHRAELVDATGDASEAPSSCDVRVLPVDSGRFSCVVRVMCDGRVLYPDSRQRAGYVSCEIENGRPVRAIDEGSTAADGDPRVDLDLNAGTVRVEEFDESGQSTYSATLRIQS